MKKIVFFITILFFTIKAQAQTTAGTDIDPSLAETSVQVKTLTGVTSGSLVVPRNITGKIPVVLIIGDSGPTDRDGNNFKTGITANTYKLLANELGKNGIASLRYDKRNVGQSVSSTKEKQLRIDDYSDDAVDLIKLLNDDQRFSKIILFGHGEGSIVGMIAYNDMPVKGFISAAGIGVTADKYLMEQMKSKPKYQQDEFKAVLDSMRKGKTTDNVDLALYYIARPSIQPFLMSWCRCNPERGIKKMKIPALIIQGTTDLIVPADNGDKLKKAKSDATLLMIKDMNHIFRQATADEEQNTATYSNPALPLKPEMIAGMVDFINKVKS